MTALVSIDLIIVIIVSLQLLGNYNFQYFHVMVQNIFFFGGGRHIGYKSWAINIVILSQISAFVIYKRKLVSLNGVLKKLNLCSLLASSAKIHLTTNGFISHKLIYCYANGASILCTGQTRSSKSSNCCYHFRKRCWAIFSTSLFNDLSTENDLSKQGSWELVGLDCRNIT